MNQTCHSNCGPADLKCLRLLGQTARRQGRDDDGFQGILGACYRDAQRAALSAELHCVYRAIALTLLSALCQQNSDFNGS